MKGQPFLSRAQQEVIRTKKVKLTVNPVLLDISVWPELPPIMTPYVHLGDIVP